MKKRSPYWLDFLNHPMHRTAIMAGAVATILASFPWGTDALTLGFLGLAALETVAVAIVPSLPSFRAYADKRERTHLLQKTRERLMQEIVAHGGSNHLSHYDQMATRIDSLYRMAEDSTSSLTRFDVERLEDATIDYLRLCLSDAVLKQAFRKNDDPKSAIESRLREVRSQLEANTLPTHEVQQLRLAEQQLTELIDRQSRMQSRRTILAASLLSIPARLEEVYQMVMTAPRASNLSTQLEDSLSKLRITEEVALELDQELIQPPQRTQKSIGPLAQAASRQAATQTNRR